MLYVYAISDSPRPPTMPGLRDSELRAVGDRGVYAIVSEHDELRLEGGEDDLWTHESVVEEAMKDAAVLPARIGGSFADEEALLASLRDRRADFERALDRVRGAVELAVTAVLDLDPLSARVAEEPIAAAGTVTTAGPGTAYMLDRLGRKRRAERVAELIDEPLAPLARARTSRLSTDAQPRLTAAYLVDRERVAIFRTLVERLEEELNVAAVTCTGPWPPYSFVTAEGES